MRKRVKFTFGLALLLSGGAFVAAQEAAPAPAPAAATVVPEDQQPTDSQLNRLFDVMRIKQQMASMAKMMPEVMQQQMDAQIRRMQEEHPEMSNLTPEQRQKFSTVMARFTEKAMTLYTADEMIVDIKGVYKKHLSQSDTENIITFYSSSSGQRILDVVPVIMQEYVPLVMHKVEERMKPLVEELQLELAQITAKPSSTGIAPKQ